MRCCVHSESGSGVGSLAVGMILCGEVPRAEYFSSGYGNRNGYGYG